MSRRKHGLKVQEQLRQVPTSRKMGDDKRLFICLPFGDIGTFINVLTKVKDIIAMEKEENQIKKMISVFTDRVVKKLSKRPFFTSSNYELEILIMILRDTLMKHGEVLKKYLDIEEKTLTKLMHKRPAYIYVYSFGICVVKVKKFFLNFQNEKIRRLVDILMNFR